MIDLRKRSYEKELLDKEDIPFPDIVVCMNELNTVNTYLGGHAATRAGVAALVPAGNKMSVCEIGCGGGDNLQAIDKAFKNVSKRFIGVDLKPECTEFAANKYPGLAADWIASDYAKVAFSEKPDVIFSSLFCHHFTDEQLIAMLKWKYANSKRGFFINDLHRHWLAFYLIKYITKYFSKSYLVRNDASLSVARSFRKEDWERLLAAAGIKAYSIHRRWAWRWLIIIRK